jgi:hypothetical protein
MKGSDPEKSDGPQESSPFPDHPKKTRSNGALNGSGHTQAGANAFGLCAPLLLRNGYSPVPIEPGGKRPLGAISDWNRLRIRPLTEAEIADIATNNPNAGLGVLGGYRGLVPIDIDTDDRAILAAINGVVPDYLVAKRGRRGVTVFYRDPKGIIEPRKLRKADGSIILEILTTGQVVIPPTIHPETQRPYQWVTEYTLLQVHIDDLPELH